MNEQEKNEAIGEILYRRTTEMDTEQESFLTLQKLVDTLIAAAKREERERIFTELEKLPGVIWAEHIRPIKKHLGGDEKNG